MATHDMLMQALDQIRALSTEVAEAGRKLNFLNQANDEKTNQIAQQNAKIAELTNSNNALVNNQGGQGSKIRLVDVKSMAPKTFSGSGHEGFKGWVKKVKAYCNASLSGYRNFFNWIEIQTVPINAQLLATIE